MPMAQAEGVIRADECYTYSEFEQRTGLGRQSIRNARKSGLAVRRLHGRGYILGKDWLRYVESMQADCEGEKRS